ncbi:uncharacterized protein KGF55_001074 [Candida pseudojiufengensis]|uniref:uncharacterized protein n=1 Tax=Candida pseudojiufengensis TaxID=497109 RepID=UPI002223F087|nr:uncharacterized protein KGF55_001074 [Candida pseudojiufengensis]KAI5965711.1 hypothetical protein KGF55_001074 [Candida pseudojiufengensis]
MSSTIKNHEKISKTRVINASILTIISILLFIELLYHLKWSIKIIYNQSFGNQLNNLIYGLGSLLANFGLSVSFLKWLNQKILVDKIEEDYKKYI